MILTLVLFFLPFFLFDPSRDCFAIESPRCLTEAMQKPPGIKHCPGGGIAYVYK